MKLTPEGGYRMTPRSYLMLAVLWIGFCAGVGWLFYDNLLISVIGWVAYPVFCYGMGRYKERQCRKQLRMEFKDVMISIYSSLSAGATVEESLQRALQDMTRCLKPDARMILELDMLCRKMERNIPIAQCLEEMSKRCDEEDIESFTQVIILGKRQGGNLAGMVRDSVEKIQRRIETTYEIEGLIGAKRSEFAFMCIIPAGIVFYMRCFSPEFMEVLFGNITGMVVMSLCLCVYGVAIAIGIWILRKAGG